MLRLTLLTLVANVLAAPYSADSPNFCHDKQPGMFAQGCSSNVTICNKFGRELWLLCPFNLIFDESIEECKDQTMVAECNVVTQKGPLRNLDGLPMSLCESAPDGFHAATGCSLSVVQCTAGVPSLMECPTGMVFDNSKSACGSPDDIPACKPSEVPSTGVSNECEGLADGLFEKDKCSSFFLTCSGGVSRIMTCPANLVFDKRFNICEYPGNVEGCSDLPEADSVCSEDGFFSYGNCSDLFYACTNGRQIPMYCPAKLAFDEARRLCDYPLAVSACNDEGSGEGSGESSGEGSGEGSGEASGESSGEASGEYSGYGVPYLSEDASGYGSGEASGESSGASGAYHYEASGGLFYEASGLYEASGESSGNLPADSTTGYESIPVVEESWDSTLEDEASGSVPVASMDFCEGKDDGFYASGCSSEMIACVAGQATSMLCPAHLIYDEKKQICEYPENVPCYVAAMDHGETQESCTKEGPSANGVCSSTFINCVEGKAYHLACDEGYVFSEAHASCVESVKLEECSTAKAEPAPAMPGYH